MQSMSMLISIVVVLVVVGLLLWALTQLPIDPQIAKVIRVLVIVVAVIWALGVLTGYVPNFGRWG